MSVGACRALAVAILAAIATSGARAEQPRPATAQAIAQGGPAREKDKKASPLGNLGAGSSKEPIKIDADRLEVFDREGRAVFSGSVVAVQGETTMKCTVMTVFYEQNRGQGAAQRANAPGEAGEGSIRKIGCKGPVTVVSKTQVATGDNAEFDRVANKVFLIGNASLSDGPNVTRGERIVYDLTEGRGTIEGGGGRVRALIVPGSQDKDAKKPEQKPQGQRSAPTN